MPDEEIEKKTRTLLAVDQPSLPVMAIVGRPNVGKSTLFNRIAKRRHAITLDQEGVTRDRKYCDIQWDDFHFRLLDTGGFPSEKAGTRSVKIRQQIDTALEEATIILFILDARAGLLPEDRAIYQTLKRLNKPFFCVVNKMDSPTPREDLLHEFYRLGEPLFSVSSEHGFGMDFLIDTVCQKLPKSRKNTLAEIRLAIIGRPNVGKSSLLNFLTGEERAIVHDEAGTTRDTVDTCMEIGGQRYRIIDTAGIRRGGTWKSRVERYSVQKALEALKDCDLCLFLLDAEEGIHKQDTHVAGAISEARKPCVVLWNKWDLKEPTRDARKEALFRSEQILKFIPETPVLFVSAKTGMGCKKIWPLLKQIHEECQIRVSTNEINRCLEELVNGHPPPIFQGKPVKFYYATQAGTNPPTIIVFVNQPKGVHFSYRRYLTNQFRKIFGFGAAPLFLKFNRKNEKS